MKFTTLLFILLTIISPFAKTDAQQSRRVWKNFFPHANCSKNDCGKDVPTEALEEMLERASYHAPSKLTNTTWAFVADFTQNSRIKRGYLIHMKTGNAIRYHVSHGVGSGDGNGNVLRTSNRDSSHQSSEGLYLTAETYSGKHGYSLKMDGLESSNSAARSRAIVIHGASYVPNTNSVKVANRIGRSHGCPAVAKGLSKDLIDKLRGGSLYYIHFP